MGGKTFFGLSTKGLGRKAFSFTKHKGGSIFKRLKNFWKKNMQRY